MQKLKKNDEVLVIAGKDKGAIGRIIELNTKKGLVKVDKVNIIKKHVKPTQQNTEGGILEEENWLNISNVAYHVKKRWNKKLGKDI